MRQPHSREAACRVINLMGAGIKILTKTGAKIKETRWIDEITRNYTKLWLG
jgi:hypothetical protein